MRTKSVSLRLDEATFQALSAEAAQKGKTLSDIIREAIRLKLDLEEFERLRSELLPYGEAAGMLTDEDVFSQVS